MNDFFKGSAIFVPAQDLHNVHQWKSDVTSSKYDMKFFTDKSFFKYNYILINAYYQASFGIENFRKTYKYPDDSIIICDSGGFQIASFLARQKNININPLQILRWIESNDCDIGMNLDIPPWTDFNSALKQSVENYNIFQINRQNYNMNLYNVLHGRNFNEIECWHKAIKGFDFDGWAYGVKPSNNIYLQAIAYDQNDAAYSLLSLHNLYQFIEVNNIINILTDDEYALHQYAIAQNEESVFNNITSMIYDYEKYGVKHTYEAFKHLMNIKKPENTERNIYAF